MGGGAGGQGGRGIFFVCNDDVVVEPFFFHTCPVSKLEWEMYEMKKRTTKWHCQNVRVFSFFSVFFLFFFILFLEKKRMMLVLIAGSTSVRCRVTPSGAVASGLAAAASTVEFAKKIKDPTIFFDAKWVHSRTWSIWFRYLRISIGRVAWIGPDKMIFSTPDGRRHLLRAFASLQPWRSFFLSPVIDSSSSPALR